PLHLHFTSFFFHSSPDHRAIHSFPTRRSSDLIHHAHQPRRGRLPPRDRDGDGGREWGTHPHDRWIDLGSVGAAAALHDREQVERSEEHTSELQSLTNLVCRLLLEKKKKLCLEE